MGHTKKKKKSRRQMLFVSSPNSNWIYILTEYWILHTEELSNKAWAWDALSEYVEGIINIINKFLC
jgi:hypothetical protein